MKRAWAAVITGTLVLMLPACARLQVPAIDPSGNRIFLPAPNSTAILTPNITNTPPTTPRRFSAPVTPAFTRPADPEPCCNSARPRQAIPTSGRVQTRGQAGEIILTPSRIIAPVGSEVVVLAGICGPDSHFVINQPLEWLLSADSVGQFIEVGGTQHSTFNRLIPPSTKKFDGHYAWGRTGLKNLLLTRGTPTPVDDIELQRGQAFLSLSSVSEGTSYVTCVAPKAQAWDKRRKSTVVHWIDAVWAIPVPKTASAGTVTPLTTLVTRSTDSGGVNGWKVRYSIVGGAPAEFAPTGSQTAEVTTNADGQATIQIRQIAGQFDPGTTQVRVDVIRPQIFGEPELKVESGVTCVQWSAPALTIRAIGPKSAGINEAFNYRVEVSNPGDQVSRGVVLSTKDFPDDLEFISSTPKATILGKQLQWQLGDIAPGSVPQVVEVQLKSASRGNNELCFEVASQTDRLQTEACAQTEISVPCLGLQIDGPSAAQVGEQATFNIVLINQCDVPLEDVELQIQYDRALVVPNLGNPIEAKLGTLAPGERKSRPIIFDVASAGRHCFGLVATAEGGHTARANECLDVTPSTAATVDLDIVGQRRVDRGDQLLIRGTVTNNGSVPIDNLTVTNRFSPSLSPTRVTEQFPHRWLGPEGDELIFDLGRLDPGQSKVVEIYYTALNEDGNAFSELTVSAPDVAASAQRYDLRIEPSGTQSNSGQGGAGGLNPGTDPPGQTEPQIGIPDDADPSTLNQQRNLEITAQAEQRQVAINTPFRVRFTVSNISQLPDQNINLSMLVPQSLQLTDVVDDLGNQVPIIRRSPDFTFFELEPRREMRPNDTLTYFASFVAVQPGQAFVELQAASDNSAGTITAAASVAISQ